MKIYGVVGWKNAGKTGLMERLVTEITGRGFTVSTVKHAHHMFDVDHPGRDSYRHREAGATEVLLSSRRRWALMHENRDEDESALAVHMGRLSPADLVLIEGYKRDTHPKVEAHRAETGNPLIAPGDPTIRAIASDSPLEGQAVPVFDLNDTVAVADFILEECGLAHRSPSRAEPEDLRPPRLRNDCFALPAGVDWVPVDDALNILRDQLSSVVGTEILPLSAAIGRVLAVEAVALRASPPGPNSAVDGYGVAHAIVVKGDNVLPLAEGRSAAGVPFAGKVPHGQALRILTGALLPDGVDTVILQEDVALRQGHLAFEGPMRIGANTRRAGEDVDAGQIVLAAGSVLTPQGAALLASVGCSDVKVYRPLRVGVLSTGDEIAAPGSTLSPEKTYDANKPMLLGIIEAWGYRAVDLGHVPDDPGLLRARLDEASNVVDVIFTSGGASAGDEDHISTVLEQAGALSTWRIAIKPGRPLALGLWQGVPVFGLPGNPVAAFVCTLLFGRPALSVMAGSDWCAPVGYNLPAAFEKDKKPGRAEYLRARLDAEGQVEIFKSEGSGRISGLNWATGLVELGVEARKICRGDPVRFIPFGSFGLPT